MTEAPESPVRRTVAGAAQIRIGHRGTRSFCFPLNCEGLNIHREHQRAVILEGAGALSRIDRTHERARMSPLEELADRVERLLLRHEELLRTNALLRQQAEAVAHERDQMKGRLTAARNRLDALLERLPDDGLAVPADTTAEAP